MSGAGEGDPGSDDPAARWRRPRDREEHARRLRQAVSGHLLFEGMRRPWLTWLLVGALVLVHLALSLRLWATGRAELLESLVVVRPERLLVRAGGQFAPAIERGQWWRLVSTVFLHGSGVHLLFNGVALLGLGRLNEAIYGRARLLLLFLACGVGGALLSYVGGHRLSIGASGAVFGLMGAPIVFGWRHRHELPRGLGDRLRRALLPWVVLNLVIGLALPFIDNLAHAGGLVVGGLVAAGMGNRVVPGREGRPALQAAAVVLSILLLSWAAWGVAGRWA